MATVMLNIPLCDVQLSLHSSFFLLVSICPPPLELWHPLHSDSICQSSLASPPSLPQLSDGSHGWNSAQADMRGLTDWLTDWLQFDQSLCSPTHATVLLMRLTLPAASSSSSAGGVVVHMCLSHPFLFSLWVYFLFLLPGVPRWVYLCELICPKKKKKFLKAFEM